MKRPTPRYPNKFLIIGVSAVCLGGGLLLWTSGYLPNLTALWPVALVLTGLSILYVAFLKHGSPGYTVPGMFLTIGGTVFLFVQRNGGSSAIVAYWPLLIAVLGVSMLPYGFNHKGYRRIAVLIPAATLVFLSAVFLPFSLGLTDNNLIDFVLTWWPVVFIVFGVGFVITYIYRLGQQKRKDRAEGE